MRICQQGDVIHIPWKWALSAIGVDGGTPAPEIPDETPYLWGGGTIDYVEIDDDDGKKTVIPVPPGGYGNYVIHIGGRKKNVNRTAAGIKLSDFPSGGNEVIIPISNGVGSAGGGTKWFPTNSQELFKDLGSISPLIVYSLNRQDFKFFIKNGDKKGAFAIYVDDFESDRQYESFYNLNEGTGPKHLQGVYLTNTEGGGWIDIPGSSGAVARIYNLGKICSTYNRKVNIYTSPNNVLVGLSGQMEGLSGQMSKTNSLHNN